MKKFKISTSYCSPASFVETGWTSKVLPRISQVVHSLRSPFAVITVSTVALRGHYSDKQALEGLLQHLLFRIGPSCWNWHLESFPCFQDLLLPPRVEMIAFYPGERHASERGGDMGRLPLIFATVAHAVRASIGTTPLGLFLSTGGVQRALDWPHSKVFPSKDEVEKNILYSVNLSESLAFQVSEMDCAGHFFFLLVLFLPATFLFLQRQVEMAASPRDAETTKNTNLVSASMPLHRARGASFDWQVYLEICNTLSESGLASDNSLFGFHARSARSLPSLQLDDSAEHKTRTHSWVPPPASPLRPQF